VKTLDFELENPGAGICTIAAAVEGDAKYVEPRLRKYAHIRVAMAPVAGPAFYSFDWQVVEGTLPFSWMKDACLEGVKMAVAEPLAAGQRLVLVRVSVIDGSYHETDTDAESVHMAARLAVRNAISNATLVPL
jgi:elongation factor G